LHEEKMDTSLSTVLKKLKSEIQSVCTESEIIISESPSLKKYKFKRSLILLVPLREPRIQLKVGRIQTKVFEIGIKIIVKGPSPRERVIGVVREGLLDLVRRIVQKIKLTNLGGLLDTSPVSQVGDIQYIKEDEDRILSASFIWTGKISEEINF